MNNLRLTVEEPVGLSCAHHLKPLSPDPIFLPSSWHNGILLRSHTRNSPPSPLPQPIPLDSDTAPRSLFEKSFLKSRSLPRTLSNLTSMFGEESPIVFTVLCVESSPLLVFAVLYFCCFSCLNVRILQSLNTKSTPRRAFWMSGTLREETERKN